MAIILYIYIVNFNFVAEKYCSLIEKEGGLILLQELIENSQPPLPVKNLASIVIENCRRYKEQEWTNVEAQLDG